MTTFNSWILRLSRALNDDRAQSTGLTKTNDNAGAAQDGNAWKASQLQDILNDAIQEYVGLICQSLKGFEIASILPELNTQGSVTLAHDDAYTGHGALPSDFGYWIDGKINTSDNATSYEAFKVGAPQWWGVRSRGNDEQSSFYLTLMSNEIHVYRQTAWNANTPDINQVSFNYIKLEPEFTAGGTTDTVLRRIHIRKIIPIALNIANEYKAKTT